MKKVISPLIPRPLQSFWTILLSCLLLAACSTTNIRDQPNIILIMSNDVGYSDIGCYGGEIDTPHLDRLAAGDALRDILGDWTRSPARGIASGAAITSLVQSSSAVTVVGVRSSHIPPLPPHEVMSKDKPARMAMALCMGISSSANRNEQVPCHGQSPCFSTACA